MCQKKHENGWYQLSLGVTPTDKTPTFHIFEKYLLYQVTHLQWHTVAEFEIIMS